MENNQTAQEQLVAQVYEFTAQQLVNGNKSKTEVIRLLTEKGIGQDTATEIVNQTHGQIATAKRSRAQKDMLFGALWCIGGTVATMSGIGFIFWGAILFGAIQFIKGAVNLA